MFHRVGRGRIASYRPRVEIVRSQRSRARSLKTRKQSRRSTRCGASLRRGTRAPTRAPFTGPVALARKPVHSHPGVAWCRGPASKATLCSERRTRSTHDLRPASDALRADHCAAHRVGKRLREAWMLSVPAVREATALPPPVVRPPLLLQRVRAGAARREVLAVPLHARAQERYRGERAARIHRGGPSPPRLGPAHRRRPGRGGGSCGGGGGWPERRPR